MWCKRCRQDMPAVAAAATGKLACTRCGATLSAEPEAQAGIKAAGVAKLSQYGVDLAMGATKAPQSPPELDDWDFEADSRRIQQLLQDFQRALEPAMVRPVLDSTGPLELPLAAGVEKTRHSKSRIRPRRAARRRTRPSQVARFVQWLAVGALLAGAALMSWGWADGRSDLWNLGVPMAIAGQSGLLLGLALAIERVWQGNRYAVDKLQEVDSQLHDLQQTAAMPAFRPAPYSLPIASPARYSSSGKSLSSSTPVSVTR